MDMFEQGYDSMKNLTDNDYKFEIHQIKENHLNEITALNEIIQNFKKELTLSITLIKKTSKTLKSKLNINLSKSIK